MRKLITLFFVLTAIFLFASPSYADSPITSTDFYRAYLDEEIVEKAADSGIVNAEIAGYLSSASNPIDKKAAVINALGWDFDGKDNAEKYANLIYEKSLEDLELESLTGEELFVIGYLMAMDDYFNTTKAASVLQMANEKIKDSLTVSLITQIVYTQKLLDYPDRWPEIWTATEKVLNDKNLKQDMRPDAVQIIVDYMILYKDESASEDDNRIYDYLKIVRLTVGSEEAEVNYVPVKLDQAAFIKNGRTLVPLRFLGESLGASVSWDGTKKQARVVLNGTDVVVTINSKNAYVNGKLTILDVPAEIKSGRTFIPLRFVSEALGASVEYEAETKMIYMTYVDTTNWKEYKSSGGRNYKYPADWTVMENETGIVFFMSPNGSYVWEATKGLSVEDTIKEVKKDWTNEGYSLESEFSVNENDPSAGKLLIFSSPLYDETNYVYVLRQEGTEEAIVVSETVVNEYYDVDDPIIMEIVFG